MTVPVIIITPSTGFGELIRQILEEDGGYAVTLASDHTQAIAAVKADKPALCILDADLNDVPLLQLHEEMSAIVPNMLLVLIPPDNDPDQEELEALPADGYLSKPFYLPDLLVTIEKVIKNSDIEHINQLSPKPAPAVKPVVEAKPPAPPPDWLKDVELAAQYLTRLSFSSASQAALITRGEEIWAYAGELPQPAAEELARTTAYYWENGNRGDLARFVRLEATGGEYMLYAIGLGGEFVLALAFNAETPFSKIRSQANDLARALASAPQELLLENAATGATGSTGNAPVEEFEDTASIKWEVDLDPNADYESPLLDDVPPAIPDDWIPQPVPSQARQDYLDEIMADVPPSLQAEEVAPAPPKPQPQPQKEAAPVVMEMPNGQTDPFTETQVSQVAPAKSMPDFQAETIPSKVDTAPDYLAETVPARKADLSEEKELRVESVSPAMYNLTYACVLLPRFPEHYLTGDLGARLSEWVTQLCVAFGWRLEHLSIRPEYLQWMVNVPPATSPGYLMRIIRQHTSRRLFLEFPRMETENPSGDFWAPGYLIVSGNQPAPSHLIKDFIHQTRERQGLSG